MRKPNAEKRDYWLDLAQYDLETAEVMLEGKRYLYVGFMCHQVIEKALKASIWVLIGSEPEYTHALARLLRISGLRDELPDNLAGLIDVLEPLNVEARYPTHKDKLMQSLTHERSAKILRQTKELYAWIKSKLSSQ
jgi:HEPN domain-containing protein